MSYQTVEDTLVVELLLARYEAGAAITKRYHPHVVATTSLMLITWSKNTSTETLAG